MNATVVRLSSDSFPTCFSTPCPMLVDVVSDRFPTSFCVLGRGGETHRYLMSDVGRPISDSFPPRLSDSLVYNSLEFSWAPRLKKLNIAGKNVDLQLARFFCNSRSSSNVSSFKTQTLAQNPNNPHSHTPPHRYQTPAQFSQFAQFSG